MIEQDLIDALQWNDVSFVHVIYESSDVIVNGGFTRQFNPFSDINGFNVSPWFCSSVHLIVNDIGWLRNGHRLFCNIYVNYICDIVLLRRMNKFLST